MKRKLGAVAAVASLAGFALVGPGSANPDFDNKYGSPGKSAACQNAGDKLEYFGPLKMWPPNHKMQGVSFVATSPNEGEDVTLTVKNDILDAVGGDGGLLHGPDVVYTGANPASGTGTVTVPADVRSERSGRGEGRQYNFQATAKYGGVPGLGIGGRECNLEVTIEVPHDMRGGADWNNTEATPAE